MMSQRAQVHSQAGVQFKTLDTYLSFFVSFKPCGKSSQTFLQDIVNRGLNAAFCGFAFQCLATFFSDISLCDVTGRTDTSLRSVNCEDSGLLTYFRPLSTMWKVLLNAAFCRGFFVDFYHLYNIPLESARKDPDLNKN